MKSYQLSVILVVLMLLGICHCVHAGNNKTQDGVSEKKILILGLQNNVKSDYYYRGLIAEESGIPADSLELIFNSVIADNIALKSNCFTTLPATASCVAVTNNIRIKGEQENCTTDLSGVDKQMFEDMLTSAGADYVLLLNQHYLKKQEEPFHTIFYFVSYTLYSKDRKELASGSNYFTTMKLENAVEMKKASRKSSDKIASAVLKLIAQQPADAQNQLLSKNK